jgi:uncharacterized protein (DUF3084 family)
VRHRLLIASWICKSLRQKELQAAVTARDEVIAQREHTIGHREDQIIESETIISQRNTVIEFLQEQAQDLTSELEDAYAYISTFKNT